MRVVAVSSGTSVDAIDVAVADLTDASGTVHLTPVAHAEVPWDPRLRSRLLAALPPALVGVGEWARLDALAGQAFGEAAAVGVALGGGADLVVSHGQTLYHWVEDGHARGTLQVGAPAWIHERTGLPVISDLRSADVAAGGQGAPLVSLLDHLWLGDRPTAALNIGGISNITVVGVGVDVDGGGQDAGVVTGDTGPGSCLLDAAVMRLTGARFDEDGALAAQGTVDEAVLAVLLEDPFYALPLPRSTGREHFHADYVAERLAAAGRDPATAPTGPDLLATLTELTARTIAAEISRFAVERVVVAGGGLRNPVLMARLCAALPAAVDVVGSTALGLDADAKEAYLFALLGYLSARGLPGTAPGLQETPARADASVGGVAPVGGAASTGLRRRATGASRAVVLGSLNPPAPPPCPPATEPVVRLEIHPATPGPAPGPPAPPAALAPPAPPARTAPPTPHQETS